jgi:hypothetical protein
LNGWCVICANNKTLLTIMARKKDPEIQENIDRGTNNQANVKRPEAARPNSEGENQPESESIKNANAAGLGAIGRNDQLENGQSG